jgi:hypothetical protein
LRNFAPIVGSVVSHRSQRSCVYGAATLAFAFFSSACAYAVSERVQQACRDDYYQHCSQYSVGTEELRQCMRKVGEGLSAPCLVALVQDGEITKEDVDRHNAAKGEKNSTKKSSTEVPSKVPSKVASKDADDPKEVSSNGGKKKKKKAGKTTETTDPSKAKSGKTKKAATATDKKDIDPKAERRRCQSPGRWHHYRLYQRQKDRKGEIEDQVQDRRNGDQDQETGEEVQFG